MQHRSSERGNAVQPLGKTNPYEYNREKSAAIARVAICHEDEGEYNDPGLFDPKLKLGREKLDTTAIYTEVSIKQLQEVNARCHPSARLPDAPPGPPDAPNQPNQPCHRAGGLANSAP